MNYSILVSLKKQMACFTQFDVTMREKHFVIPGILAVLNLNFPLKVCDSRSLNNCDTCNIYMHFPQYYF